MRTRSATERVFRAAGKWLAAFVLVTVTAGFGSCSGGGGGGPQGYLHLQGSVSGLSPGQSVVLQIDGNGTTAVSANGSFQFSVLLAAGDPYSVTVFTQPIGEICSIVNGTGTGTVRAGSSVTIACTPGTYTVSGMVTGATGPVGLQLYLDVNDSTTPIGPPLTVVGTQVNVPVPFTLIATAPLGTPYEVTVPGDPPYEQCGVDDNTPVFGLGTADVTGAVITCGWLTGVTVTGLSPNSSVTLGISYEQLNSGQIITAPVTVTANGDCGAQCLANATVNHPNTVAVTSQPAGEICTVGAPQGTPGQAEVFVPVVCSPGSYTIGGVVTGLFAGESVVLQDNGGNATSVSANGPFTFSTQVAYQSPYAVTVATQPAGENCSITNGSGMTPAANVNNVAVACAASSYTIGGTISGLASGKTIVLQDNGGNATTVSANGQFTFSTAIAYQSPYAVTIATQPAGQSCSVTNGSGTTPAANVTNISVVCVPGYTIGGAVSGLSGGKSVVLRDNGSNATTVSANGPFTFSTALANQSPYAVTVATPPVGETCTVTNGSGTVAAANVTNIAVACTAASYTIGGTVSGLSAGESVVLENNGGNATTVSANGPFTFSTPIAYQSPYAVTVETPPAGETCGVTNGSGTTPAANVTNVAVTCAIPNEWTWESGSDIAFAAGVYGMLGRAAAGNVPGARYGIVSWVDAANNLWLFGGAYANASGDVGELNDLWEYNLTTGLWTWQGGASTLNSAGSYGTQGVPAPTNVPGARAYAVSWTDSAGNFWLFGGSSGVGVFNDLWRYTPSTGLWTWISGSNSQNAVGIYGTQGTAAAGNVPGARQGMVSWTDKAGNLWLLGGYGLGASNSYLNDLWVYSTSTGLWTWVGGSDVSSALGVYGTQGVAAPGNVPGARTSAISWTDPSRNFWLFGGADSAGAFNDLWSYNPTTGLWTWMSGSNVTGTSGVYGTQGTAAPGNTPGARYSPMSWADEAGNLWLFGGTVYGGSFLNDLWEYSPSSDLWTWIGGSNQQRQVGVYGTLGVAAPANIPGARTSSATWVDGAGNVWLFGGDAFVSADPSYPGIINDLWKYAPP